MRGEMVCNYCECKTSFEICADYIVFCPVCKRLINFVCEYGYGPVTPCTIYLGDKVIGRITEDKNYKYWLDIKETGKKVQLKTQYLNALYESIDIMKRILTPERNCYRIKPYPILKKTGSLYFYEDKVKIPKDTYKITTCSYEDGVLDILFDKLEYLIVVEPAGITNTEDVFSIRQAKKIKWSWLAQGSFTKRNQISYVLKEEEKKRNSIFGNRRPAKEPEHFALWFE